MSVISTRTQLLARQNEILSYTDPNSFTLHGQDLPIRTDVLDSLTFSRVVNTLPTDAKNGDFAYYQNRLYYRATNWVQVTHDTESGTTLPSSPAVGETFILTSGARGFYYCVQAGTWSFLPTDIISVFANPTANATAVLRKLQVGDVIYSIPEDFDIASLTRETPVLGDNFVFADSSDEDKLKKVSGTVLRSLLALSAGTGITISSNTVSVTNPFTSDDETKLDNLKELDTAEIIRVIHGTPTDNQEIRYDADNTRFEFFTPPAIPARAGAFTAADETKLDGIEAEAQKNPNYVSLPFRTQNGSTAVPGQIVFIEADNTDWESGSSDLIVAIEIDSQQYTLTQNPSVDNAEYTGWHSLPENIAENRGSTIWTFQRIANSTPFAPISGTLIIQSETIIKNSDGNFVLQNLKVLQGLNQTFGTGVNWQVVGVFAPPSGADAIIGALAKGKLPSDVVYTEQLQGHEDDKFASYNNAFVGSGYRAGFWVLSSDTNGPPTADNQIGQPDIATGSGVLAIGRLRTDADPNNLQWSTVPAAGDLVSGDIWYASIDGDKNSHLQITLTSGGTLVGTGNSAYVWATASWVEVGNIASVTEYGDYFRLGKEEPTQLKIEIPYTDILGAPWVETDGSNVTDEFREIIQGRNEDEDLSNFTRVASGLASGGDNRYSISGSTVTFSVAVDSNYTDENSTSDDAKFYRAGIERAWIMIGNWLIEIDSINTRYISQGRAQYLVTYNVISGTAPALNSTSSLEIIGEDVHRGQLVKVAFRDNNPNISGTDASNPTKFWREDGSWQEPEGGIEDPAAQTETKFYLREVPSQSSNLDPLWSEYTRPATTRFLKELTGVGSSATTFLTETELAAIGNNDLIHGQIFETGDNWKTYPFSFRKARLSSSWRWFVAADDSGGYTNGSRYQFRLSGSVAQIQEQGQGPSTATVDIYVTPV